MKDRQPLRVLQVTIGDGNYGGVASFLYNYYARMDHRLIHFDFLYCGSNSMRSKMGDPVMKESEVTELRILKPNDNGIKEYRRLLPVLKKIFQKKHYDIVHVNSSNPYVNACIAFVLGGKTVYIAHSHNTGSTIRYGSKVKQYMKNVIGKAARSLVVSRADAMYACSMKAGKYLFGDRGTRSGKFKVIHNAIETGRYAFDPCVREQYRNEMSAGENLVVGFDGRLSDQKNPLFALSVFSEIHKLIPSSVMWFAGAGELQKTLEEKIRELRLEGSVKLLGQRNDVEKLMQAMDIFLFPSVYEGFGMAALEAQCSGLRVFASSEVPEDVNVTGLVSFLPLSLAPEAWAVKIAEALDDKYERSDKTRELKKNGYEISSEAERLLGYYQLMWRRKSKGNGR